MRASASMRMSWPLRGCWMPTARMSGGVAGAGARAGRATPGAVALRGTNLINKFPYWKTLWNFPDTSTLHLTGVAAEASIFAPFADVTLTQMEVWGFVVAGRVTEVGNVGLRLPGYHARINVEATCEYDEPAGATALPGDTGETPVETYP